MRTTKAPRMLVRLLLSPTIQRSWLVRPNAACRRSFWSESRPTIGSSVETQKEVKQSWRVRQKEAYKDSPREEFRRPLLAFFGLSWAGMFLFNVWFIEQSRDNIYINTWRWARFVAVMKVDQTHFPKLDLSNPDAVIEYYSLLLGAISLQREYGWAEYLKDAASQSPEMKKEIAYIAMRVAQDVHQMLPDANSETRNIIVGCEKVWNRLLASLHSVEAKAKASGSAAGEVGAPPKPEAPQQ